jgi:hypothetical protein
MELLKLIAWSSSPPRVPHAPSKPFQAMCEGFNQIREASGEMLKADRWSLI